jgi:two-component system phosphate regulon response regulator PhoB
VPRVLVVGADGDGAEDVRRALAREGLEVSLAPTADDAVASARDVRADAVIVDALLRGRSGFAVCRLLRESEPTRELPILMLTPADSELDRVLAFEAGADDAVQRPYFPRELALRVRALLRRRRASARDDVEGVYAAGPMVVDTQRRAVRAFGSDVSLSEVEFSILSFLARSPGRVFGRDEIVRAVWGPAAARSARLVDAHVKSIRRKLGRAGALVESVRGIGYRVTDKAP